MPSRYVERPCPHCGVLLFVLRDAPITAEDIECDRRGGHWRRPRPYSPAAYLYRGVGPDLPIQQAEDYYRSLVVDDHNASDRI